MNERTKQLALQASKQAFPTGSMAWMEVFAELIVRECIDVVEDDDGATHVRELISKHFGVEG